jgi:hypothetical protein
MIVSIMNHLNGEDETMRWARGKYIVAPGAIFGKRKDRAVRRVL